LAKLVLEKACVFSVSPTSSLKHTKIAISLSATDSSLVALSANQTIAPNPIGHASPEIKQDTVEGMVSIEAECQRLVTLEGIDQAGSALTAVSNITSSDSFGTVMGYLQRFVDLGDAIAEVRGSFSHTSSFSILLSGSSVCKTRLDGVISGSEGSNTSYTSYRRFFNCRSIDVEGPTGSG